MPKREILNQVQNGKSDKINFRESEKNNLGTSNPKADTIDKITCSLSYQSLTEVTERQPKCRLHSGQRPITQFLTTRYQLLNTSYLNLIRLYILVHLLFQNIQGEATIL